MASPPRKKQRTTGSTSGSGILQGDTNEERDDLKYLLCDSEEDLQKALQEPEQVEVEGDHLSNIQAERDQILQGDTNEERDDLKYLLCDSEQDLQKALQEPEQVEVKGAHLSNIQVYIRKQLPALHVTNLDAVARASIVESMLTSSHDAQAIHLAIQLFDRYCSKGDSVNSLPPEKVASICLDLATKHMHAGGEVSTQTTRGEEFQILNVLKYYVNAPTLKKLVDACVRAIRARPTVLFKIPMVSYTIGHALTPRDNKLIPLCSYLTDLAMIDRDCTRYQITILAAGVLFLAQSIVYPTKVHRIRRLWKCNDLHLKQVVTILHELYLNTRLPHCQAIRFKYSTPQFEEIATWPCPATILEVVDF